MSQIIFLNGQYLPLKRAGISPYDLGFLRGYGVFDFMITANGKPFMLDDHWSRLQKSAKELKLTIPVGKEKYEKILKKLLVMNGLKKSAIRTMITGGASPDGVTPSAKVTFLILIEKPAIYPPDFYSRGAKLISVEYQRECPQVKINNYVTAIKNLKRKKKARAVEILYVNNGKILEASTSNIFIVKNKNIITPKDNVLHGITRQVVISLARKNKFRVMEREIPEKEMFNADEVFITASNKYIIPIVKVEKKIIGAGRPGGVTKTLMQNLGDLIAKY